MPRIFSLDQANRALPLVMRIVGDIVRYHARWREMVATCEIMHAPNSERAREQARNLQEEIQQTASEIDRFLSELEQIGARFKDFDMGLVDFPAELDGREILLCWRLGEPSVEYWHEIDGGFDGRIRV